MMHELGLRSTRVVAHDWDVNLDRFEHTAGGSVVMDRPVLSRCEPVGTTNIATWLAIPVSVSALACDDHIAAG